MWIAIKRSWKLWIWSWKQENKRYSLIITILDSLSSDWCGVYYWFSFFKFIFPFLQLTLGPKKETLYLELGLTSVKSLPELGLASVKSLPADEIFPRGLDQSPSIMGQAAQITEISDIHYPVNQIPFSSTESINENTGAHGVPDLNLTADEFTGMVDLNTANQNLSRVMAAQARRNRIQIYRVKNSIAANKLRYRWLLRIFSLLFRKKNFQFFFSQWDNHLNSIYPSRKM